jgi:hypothetical protein
MNRRMIEKSVYRLLIIVKNTRWKTLIFFSDLFIDSAQRFVSSAFSIRSFRVVLSDVRTAEWNGLNTTALNEMQF